MRLFFAKLPMAILIAFLLAPCRVTAQELPIIFEDYPPYEYVEDGEVKGINLELIREALRRMGIRPIFEPRPWKRALSELKNGEILALSSGFKTPERETFAYFPQEGLALERVVVISLAGRELQVKAIEDLRGLKVGVRKEYSYGGAFDTVADLEKVQASSNKQLIQLLVRERVDVIVGDRVVFTHLAKKMHQSHKLQVLFEINSEPLYLFFSRARGEIAKDLAKRFGEAVREMKLDGTFQTIEGRY